MNILILYPEKFKCYSKFSRKLSHITQNITDFAVVFPSDLSGFIVSFFSEEKANISVFQDQNYDMSNITHAIVFDDGEEFPEELEKLKAKKIHLRLIKISITRVVNIKIEEKYKKEKSTPIYEYIGRGSYWGNPYSMYEGGDDREEVIRKFKYDFDYEKFPNKEKAEVFKLLGKRLGCFCKPKICHGDVLADFLNSWDDDK